MKTKTPIKFGTDGWRSVIADGFTFNNVRRVTQATCDVLRRSSKSRLIVIGYDNRFFSPEFAQTAAHVAIGNGFKVEMCSEPVSSPCLAFIAQNRKSASGIMITASHNPATFNGFKIKSPHGGSADESVTFSIEDRMDVSEIQTDDKAEKRVDFSTPYLAFVKKFFKNLSLRNLPGPVVFDSMHGPGGRLFEKLLNGHDKIVIIRKEADPLFGGVNPEPIEVNLDALKEAVQKNKAVAGIAVDGDADRIGLIDEKGRYLPPHTVMPLLLLHLIENKKLKGRVMQTVSMGFLNGRIATKFNLPFEEVPVGFKHIAKKMREEKVLFGGEESGGYGVGLWFAERDALINALLVIELLTHTKKKLSELVDDLYKRFGVSHFKRTDYVVPFTMEKAAWTTHVVSNVGQMFAGLPVKSVSSVDGVKIILNDDSWVLMRPSGTEPLIRTYAESVSGVTVDKLLQEADRLVHIPPPNAQKDAAAKKAAKARAAKKKQAK
jgi:phosphomannomutase